MKIISKKAIAISVIWTILTVTISTWHILNNLTKINTKDNSVYYTIQHETNPLDIDLSKLQKTYKDLNKSFSKTGYQYLEVYYQYLEPVKENHKKFYTVQDELKQPANTIQAVQISINVLNDSDISKGRYFKPEDYMYYRDAVIPVLMGNAYKNIYDVGDRFEAIYLYQKYSFQIVGFLQKETEISAGERSTITDDFLVMPSFNLGEDADEDAGYRIHYANKISGLVQASKYSDSDMNEITEILANDDIGRCTVQIFPYKYRKVGALNLLTLSKWMTILLMIECVAYVGLLLHNKKKQLYFESKIHSILILPLSLLWIYVIDVFSRKIIGVIVLDLKSVLTLIIIALLSYNYLFKNMSDST